MTSHTGFGRGAQGEIARFRFSWRGGVSTTKYLGGGRNLAEMYSVLMDTLLYDDRKSVAVRQFLLVDLRAGGGLASSRGIVAT